MLINIRLKLLKGEQEMHQDKGVYIYYIKISH